MLKKFLILSRIYQWPKNAFVIAGFIFSKDHDTTLLWQSLTATFCFCLASSATYIFNDYIDIEKDKLHSIKKNRPLASGELKIKNALLFGVGLIIVSLIISYLCSSMLTVVLTTYMGMNFLYSKYLKNLVLWDVFCISFGFLLRLFAGTLAIGIEPSRWILLCTLVISLFLGFCKRYAELSQDKSTRPVLKQYDDQFLLMAMGICGACTVLSYGLYTISIRTIEVHQTQNLFYTLPFVIFGIFRYMWLVLKENYGEDPSQLIIKDKQLFFCVLIYLLVVGTLISNL